MMEVFSIHFFFNQINIYYSIFKELDIVFYSPSSIYIENNVSNWVVETTIPPLTTPINLDILLFIYLQFFLKFFLIFCLPHGGGTTIDINGDGYFEYLFGICKILNLFSFYL